MGECGEYSDADVPRVHIHQRTTGKRMQQEQHQLLCSMSKSFSLSRPLSPSLSILSSWLLSLDENQKVIQEKDSTGLSQKKRKQEKRERERILIHSRMKREIFD